MWCLVWKISWFSIQVSCSLNLHNSFYKEVNWNRSSVEVKFISLLMFIDTLYIVTNTPELFLVSRDQTNTCTIINKWLMVQISFSCKSFDNVAVYFEVNWRAAGINRIRQLDPRNGTIGWRISRFVTPTRLSLYQPMVVCHSRRSTNLNWPGT